MITSENQCFLARVAYQSSGAPKKRIPVGLSCWVVFSLFAVLAAHSGNAVAQEVEWHDAASFEIEGKGWAQTAGPFDRLPDSAKAKVNSTAWYHSKESAGICIRFTTDAAAVSVRWSLTSTSLAMPHMPATGCSGLDLYARAANGEWRFIGNCRPGKQDGNQSTIEFPDGAKAKRECLLYLPAYNGTKSLEIGVPASSQVEKAAVRPEGLRKPVIVYGTSITQGGCASRPGMIWTSILGRMLDRPVINLGFSGSGDMAPPVGEVLAEIDAAAYVIDCTWNMGTGKEMFLDHVTKLVQAIRKTHPVTPILFMGQSMFRPDAHPTERTRDQDFAVQKLQKDGVQGLVIVPPIDFIGDDGEGTVDGVHYNDIGMQRQAQSLFTIVSMAVSVPMKPRVSVDPIVISKGGQAHFYQAFPDACRLKNGDILVAFYAGYNHVSLATDDFPLGGRLCLVCSSDEGRTWTAPAVLYDDADDNRDPHLSQLDDGTVVCTFFSTAVKNRQRLKTLKDPKNYDLPRIETGVQIVFSRDNGKTWEPQAREAIPGWLCSAPVRQLPDGTCVLGLYRGDEKTSLSVAGTARSTDRCSTWETPFVIKAPEGVGLNAETDVIRLADGRLYAAMRSFTDDMYYAVSDNEAKSWTEAKKVGFPAHAPHLNRLSDGRIILSHRLPNTSIHVSHDDTKTWQGPYLIDSCIGAYPATVELKDHSILIVYYTEGGGSAIRARRFNLKPDGIEFLPL